MSTISLQGVAQLLNVTKEIKLGGALAFEDLNINLDTEVVEIIKGFVILGAELLNTLNTTDPEESKRQSGTSTNPSENASIIKHEFKTKIDSHLRVLLPSAKLSVSSSEVGTIITFTSDTFS